MLREDYVKIPAEVLGEDFEGYKEIFGKRLGRYILWVGYKEEDVKEDERMVVEPMYIRFALLELGEDDEGNIIVTDYWYFDLTDADALKLIFRIKKVISGAMKKDKEDDGKGGSNRRSGHLDDVMYL